MLAGHHEMVEHLEREFDDDDGVISARNWRCMNWRVFQAGAGEHEGGRLVSSRWTAGRAGDHTARFARQFADDDAARDLDILLSMVDCQITITRVSGRPAAGAVRDLVVLDPTIRGRSRFRSRR